MASNKSSVELKVSGLVHGYRQLKPIDNLGVISKSLYDRLSKLEQQELGRIDQLFALAVGTDCQAARLSAHFGQSMPEACGNCSACRGESVDRHPAIDPPQIGTSAITGLAKLAIQYPAILNEPRNRAKFLCGLTSPALIRSRLTREPLYGCCSEVPFGNVTNAVNELKSIRS